MTEASDISSPQDIEKAIAAARASMPAYADLLDFYGRIFTVQADGVEAIRPAGIDIDPQRAALAFQEGFPLATPDTLPVDIDHGVGLLMRLCRAVEGLAAELAGAAARIRSALNEGRLAAEALLKARLGPNPSRFDAMAADLGIPVEMLAFFADQSLAPSRVAGRRRTAALLKDDAEWKRGYCPVCGTPPALGVIAEDGQRRLCCGLCWHSWPVQRVRCVQCGQTDPAKLYYLYSDEEPAYRLDACEACRHYLKTVDRRRLGRPFFAPLEQVLTTHLDLLAAEKNLSPLTGALVRA